MSMNLLFRKAMLGVKQEEFDRRARLTKLATACEGDARTNSVDLVLLVSTAETVGRLWLESTLSSDDPK